LENPAFVRVPATIRVTIETKRGALNNPIGECNLIAFFFHVGFFPR